MTDYSILAKYILKKYIGNISGKNIDDVFVDVNPEEKIMIGKLAANRVKKSLSGGYLEISETEFKSIPLINLSFSVVKHKQARLFIKPRGILMYTIQPDYEKTLSYVLTYLAQKYHSHFSSADDLVGYDISIPFPATYRKIEISDYLGEGFSLQLDGALGEISLAEYFANRLHDLYEKIASEIRICRNSKIVASDLVSKNSFERAIAIKEERVYPQWLFDVYCKISEEKDSWFITMQMVNRTVVENSNIGYLPIIFDAGLTVTGNENVCYKEIKLENLMTSYKNRDPIYAISENTAVTFEKDTNSLVTDNVPYYIQYRLKTNDELNKYATFDALLESPVDNLTKISKAMRVDYELCEKEYSSCKRDLCYDADEKYKSALEEYRNEITRFENGILMIQYRDYVAKAFQYMIESFQQNLPSESRHIDGWRLFQVVFIVSMIPKVIQSEYQNEELETDSVTADLLYFPTGGGKTEAFLGVCVFTIFFDRLRGKNVGISAFLKYPLRLLAVQQLDRVLTVIAKANIILKKHKPNLNPFLVGFYVGSGVTPNNFKDIIKENYGPDLLNENYRFIDTCPYCGKKHVNVRFDKMRQQLRHFCDNPDCSYKELPLVVVDDEVYRYLPAIVICTIDKMATLGLNTDFKAIFGQVKSWCPVHGFSVKSTCSVFGCNEITSPVSELKDPIPTLFVQDEMHLVKESLGTFDAHYEAFIDYYSSNLVPEKHRKKIRYIGATATISRYRDHVWHLYHKHATRFPCEYPSRERGKDFYSYTDKDDISRIITGFAPYGHTSIMDGMWRSVYEMHKLVFDLMQNYESTYQKIKKLGFSGECRCYLEMLYDYWVELVYNNRKNDADELMNSFTNQANNSLLEIGVPLFEINTMTSDSSFQNIRQILFGIKENRRKLESTNLILATSTISHGVDEDSFNTMFFFGMPNNNAEYIQAYSRVGRKYSGIVVDIIRLVRLRDRSYLKNFVIFHANKDDLVETVPINRWARNAIYSTLPGLLAGLCYQYLYPQMKEDKFDYKAIKLQKLVYNGDVKPDDLSQILIDMLGCGDTEKLSKFYCDIIRSEVSDILQGIRDYNFDSSENLSNAIKRFSKGNLSPMTSLRDTQEEVYIDLRN